jgi:hypothetical protein
LLLKAGEKPLFLKTIAIFMIGSIVAFFVVIVSLLLDVSSCGASYVIILVSLVILATVLYMLVTLMKRYREREKDLKKILEG